MNGRLDRNSIDFPEKIAEFVPDVKEIYFEGDLSLVKEVCVGVVGSRRATLYGRTVAESIGRRMGENNIVLVSGLAKGIDTAAHKGILENGGKTIAVLGGGTDAYYPSQNRELQQKIALHGLLLSEYPPGFEPKPYTFPRRNRIISGISDSVVIVEAGNRSGALITAECAAEQGKNLYAVPGNITSHYSFGTNKLIRESVTPLIIIDDLLTDLDITPNINEKIISNLGRDEKAVYEQVEKRGEIELDEIYHTINKTPSEINGIITILEMKGIIFTCLGKICVAKF